eukprot:9180381-Alexandrium_andersonii.AAC.1
MFGPTSRAEPGRSAGCTVHGWSRQCSGGPWIASGLPLAVLDSWTVPAECGGSQTVPGGVR